ncbi:MAG: radical SAM protein [Deltaproteobacteria bacterium]|nr:MAG: radical SAM protein [Deltaproteobacteria bacterium]
MKHRFENFGGIIASDEPPFLAFVDREFMREMGLGESPLWKSSDDTIGLLSAPTEVHLATTEACPVQCRHCYMSAKEGETGELTTEKLKAALEVLAEMGVFHVALGGGEALVRSDLFEIATYTRELGMVPNLTVSGALMTAQIAQQMKLFGQINVSVDGVGLRYGVFRSQDRFDDAHRAIKMLLDAGVSTGINCVVGRRNFDGIPELFQYAKEHGLNEIEFLRFKPVGRGSKSYLLERTTYEQNLSLLPMLSKLSERHGLCAKIDCSFIPMLCAHNPPRQLLETTATYGCEAGNVLLGIRSDGSVSGCSFLQGEGLSVFDLRAAWASDENLEKLRTWPRRAPEPCRSCPYLDICKGGCHAVSAAVTGNIDAPDPDCPRVARFQAESE